MGDDLNHAMIGNLIIERVDGEPVPAFRARARDTALGIGADLLIFGLLSPVIWVDDREAEITDIAGTSAAGVEVSFGGSPKMNVNDDPSGSSKGE